MGDTNCEGDANITIKKGTLIVRGNVTIAIERGTLTVRGRL